MTFAKMLIVAAGVCGSVALTLLSFLFDVRGRQHADDVSSALLWLLGGDDGVALYLFRDASNHLPVRPSLIRGLVETRSDVVIPNVPYVQSPIELGARDVPRCVSGRAVEAFGPRVEESQRVWTPQPERRSARDAKSWLNSRPNLDSRSGCTTHV